jgi:putative two-component system response regulator
MNGVGADVLQARPVILVVDDEEPIRSLFRRLLTAEGYDVHVAGDGPSALAHVATNAPDVILLDLRLPGDLDGFEVCRRVRNESTTRLTPVVMVTGVGDREARLRSIEAGADDFVTKPVDREGLLVRVRSLARLKQYTDDLDSAASILMTLSSMIEARDGHSEGHCYRMAHYATRLGRALLLDNRDLGALYRGGFLHDIGMLAIPDVVLRKTGPLDPAEYELIKSHTIVGDELCRNLRSLRSVRPVVRHHHERLDGTGYPDGLRGAEVPLLAQIVGVADVYDAVTTQAPHQSAQTVDHAVRVLRDQVAAGWKNRDLVETFIELIRADQANQPVPTS